MSECVWGQKNLEKATGNTGCARFPIGTEYRALSWCVSKGKLSSFSRRVGGGGTAIKSSFVCIPSKEGRGRVCI